MKNTAKTRGPYFFWFACISMVLASDLQAEQSNSTEISGYLMLDYDQYDSFYRETSSEAGNNWEVRRARLNFKKQFNQHWRAKLQLSLNDKPELKDAYLKYSGWNFAKLVIGQQKEPFGLQALMGSRDLFFIERSLVSEAIAPGRTPGVSLQGELGAINWQAGYFKENGQNGESLTARASWAGWQQPNQLLHLGFAVSERKLSGQTYRINQPLEVHLADSVFESQKIEAEHMSLTGLEAFWQRGGLSSMAEWQQATVKDIDDVESDYIGGYWQLAYAFSASSRKYKNGELQSSADVKGWEIAFRLSELEIKQTGHRAELASFGVNYYWDKNIKMMANLSQAKMFENDQQSGVGDALSLRLQWRF